MKTVSRAFAQRLANKGYRGPTPMVWDRYNPQSQENAKLNAPSLDWRLSPSRGNFDDTCCLAAPSRPRGVLELIKRGLK